jgi:two-component system, LytTR family, sensor kinase
MNIAEKYPPYIFIAILCVVTGLFRLALIPEFPWYIHLAGFFVQFVFMSGMWQLIKLINLQLEKRFALENNPAIQIGLQVAVTLLLLSPVLYISYTFFKPYLPEFIHGRVLLLVTAVFFVMIMLMTFVYYTYTLFLKQKKVSEERSRLQVMAVQLEKEKSMMQYHHLKNQVNPHFLFNTLTSLDGLVQTDPALASDFIRHLSKVYRYVLEHKENEVVSMETELAFIQHYISLLSIRYQDVVEIAINVSAEGREKGIVMVTLQMLVDNAIKHNIAQPGTPLKIKIWDEGEFLHISNNKQLRRQIESSTKQGLQQLRELYQFLTPLPVEIKDGEDNFDINLPFL